MVELVARHSVAGQGVHRMQRGGPVARPPAESRPHRNALRQRDRDAKPVARCIEHHARGAYRQVLVSRPESRSFHLECDAGVRAPQDELVRHFQQRERGFDLMKAG